MQGGVSMTEATLTEARNDAVSAAEAADTAAIAATAAPPLTGAAARPEAAVLASETIARRSGDASNSIVPPAGARRTVSTQRSILASDCGCGGGATCSCGAAKTVQLVYALGKLGYDFGTEARRDTFVQAMPGDTPNPYDLPQMAEYLRANPFEAELLIWTLNLELLRQSMRSCQPGPSPPLLTSACEQPLRANSSAASSSYQFQAQSPAA